MENHLPLPVFDDFEYFKKFIYKKEGPVIENYTHEDQTYIIKSSNIDFYHHYIKPFGFEFIENKASQATNNTLRKELAIQIKLSKNYQTVSKYKIIDFIERGSIETLYRNEVESFLPFDNTSDLYKVLDNSKNKEQLVEVSAILIAFYFYNLKIKNTDLHWFNFMQIFCKTFGNQKGLSYAQNIFSQAKRFLKNFGHKLNIPFYYPKKSGLDLSPQQFYKTFLSIGKSDEKIQYEHIHIGKQTYYENYMQLFPIYASLRNSHGKNFIAPLIKSKVSVLARRINIFKYIYDHAYNEEQERFLDFLSMLDYEFITKSLSSYIPVSSYSLEDFVNNNYYIRRDELFTKYLGILLTYWLYDEKDLSYSTSLYIHSLIKSFIVNADKEKGLEKIDKTYTIQTNEIIKEANGYGKILNLPLIPYASGTTETFTESGEDFLPWKYIDFKENYLLLYHPNHYKEKETYIYGEKPKEPYRLDMKGAKYSYNAIKVYFEYFVPMLKIIYKHGEITGVKDESKVDLDQYVSEILYRTSKEKVKIKIKRSEHKSNKYRTYTKQEASSLVQMKKSFYLEELCKMQLPAYKVYHFTESRTNVSSYASEDIFCFVLKESYSYLVIAIENTLDSRSTILFYVKKDELVHALDVINTFFSSSTLNKRQSLQWKAVDFNDSSIERYERIIHTSFGEWKELMNHYTR